MPGPSVTPFQSDHQLPKQVDVVIIGGGIIGCATALELAERDLSVLICEKGQIAGEQSSRNWGWVRLSKRDAREIPLMIESIRLWGNMDRRTGRKTGYVRSGILYTAATDKVYARREKWARNLEPHQIEHYMVSGAKLDELLPGNRLDVKGALYTPEDGRAEPQLAAPAIAEAARDAGTTVMTGCAVRSLDLEAGRVAGVVTEKGRVKCSSVVLAGGAWSRLFAGNAGLDLPQLKVTNTVLRTTPADGPEISVWTEGFGIRKRADGGYTIASGLQNTVEVVPDSFRLGRKYLPALFAEWRSLKFRFSSRWSEEARQARSWRPDEVTPFENTRVLDPAPLQRDLRTSWAAATMAFPALETADIVQSWAGLIDVTPDAIPVISGVDQTPGLFIATGFSGHGFGIAPGAGRLMADLVTNADPVVKAHDFRFARFSDGSRIFLNDGF